MGCELLYSASAHKRWIQTNCKRAHSTARRQKFSPRAHLCNRLPWRSCSAFSFLALHREVSAKGPLFLHGPYICWLCGRVCLAARSRGFSRAVTFRVLHFLCSGQLVTLHRGRRHGPRAMGHGAAQVPVAWHLGWPRSTPGGHVTKLAPQCIVSTSLPRGRQANRRGREAPARLTCQPGPWAGRRPLHWRIAAGAEAAGGAQRSPAMMAGAKRIATSIARPVPARAGNTSSGTGTALAGPRSSRREEARAPSLGTSASAPLPEGWHQAVAAGAAPSGTAAHSPGGATYKNSVGGTNGKSTPGPGALNLITMGPPRPPPPPDA